ncbi:MAG: helix-turn-helix domain-containing protein [Chloroflexaceae bacterium]|jgi:DNA-binding transcriptional MerR regulator|nr:helix-turn-helix domain-containing protein [Chloroflexaceae bacterium]
MLRIGDIAKLVAVSTRTLRLYAEQGLFLPEAVDPHTGYRYYTLQQLPQLQRILALKELGLSLADIRQAVDTNLEMNAIRALLEAKQRELQAHVQETQGQLAAIAVRLRQLDLDDHSPYDVILKPTAPCHTDPQCDACESIAALQAGTVVMRPNMVSLHTPVRQLPPSLVGNHLCMVWDEQLAARERLWLPFTSDHVQPDAVGAATILHYGDSTGLFAAHRALLSWIDQHRYTIAGHLQQHTWHSGSTSVITLSIPVARQA